MGGGLSAAVATERPDMKGHRAFFVGCIKPKIRGEPVKWTLTRKHFQGIKATPWGIAIEIDFSEESGFLSGRKLNLSIGEMKNVMTDRLEVLNLGGNKGVTGNMAVLAPCVCLRELDFNLCKVFGDVRVLEKCSLLKSLDLGDSKVAGNLASLKECTSLTILILRWSKIVGNIDELENLPLENVDLMGTGCKGDVGFFAKKSETLVQLNLKQCLSIHGDVGALEECALLTHLDLSKMPEVEGDIGIFEACTELEQLFVNETKVDCDNIGKLKHELKGCEIKGNPSLVEA